MSGKAIFLANNLLATPYAKSTHGVLRGPSRYQVLAVIDPSCAGQDAGQVLDGRPRGIPVLESVGQAMETLDTRPDTCVVGVATAGGTLPADVKASLLEAAREGMTLVNGLHQLLADDPEVAGLAGEKGCSIIDIRRPRPFSELRFWSGAILQLGTPLIAVLGTDCALGKRTTAMLVREACRRQGLATELIYTGQTGWLQGLVHGFIFDATPNDFVSGELEGAILACQEDTHPDLILLEGQGSLRNPSGPCGSEFILSAALSGVVLQDAPARRHFEGLEELGCRIPPLQEEIDLIQLLGAQVLAVTLSHSGLTPEQAEETRHRLAGELSVPVVLPLLDGVDIVVQAIQEKLGSGTSR